MGGSRGRRYRRQRTNPGSGGAGKAIVAGVKDRATDQATDHPTADLMSVIDRKNIDKQFNDAEVVR